jgi:hypothetical protein
MRSCACAIEFSGSPLATDALIHTPVLTTLTIEPPLRSQRPSHSTNALTHSRSRSRSLTHSRPLTIRSLPPSLAPPVTSSLLTSYSAPLLLTHACTPRQAHRNTTAPCTINSAPTLVVTSDRRPTSHSMLKRPSTKPQTKRQQSPPRPRYASQTRPDHPDQHSFLGATCVTKLCRPHLPTHSPRTSSGTKIPNPPHIWMDEISTGIQRVLRCAWTPSRSVGWTVRPMPGATCASCS